MKLRNRKPEIKQEELEAPPQKLSGKKVTLKGTKSIVKKEKNPVETIQRRKTSKRNKLHEVELQNVPRIQPLHSKKLVGAHVSAAGGVENAVYNAYNMGASAFAFFTRSQRTWNCKPLTESNIANFKQAIVICGYTVEQIVPHGSYLINCGCPDEEIRLKSQAALLDEVRRCEMLGLKFYNFHPGSTRGEISVAECIANIATCINYVLGKTNDVIILIENMSCQGHTVGGAFEELRDIILLVTDQTRIGVCFDTCHGFAAGFDLSIKDGFTKCFSEFDDAVGLKYLRAMHLNDSKGEVGCNRDRHENIGKGFIGKDGFKFLMNDSRFNNIPMILETPYTNDGAYAKEIKLLYTFCSMKTEVESTSA